MKKGISLLLVLFVLAFTACGTEPAPPTEEGTVITEGIKEDKTDMNPGENLPVSRALAAKMIALAFSDAQDIHEMDKEIAFTDVSEDDWFYEYVNAVVYLGRMQGYEQEFVPNEPLSLSQVQILLGTFSDTKLEVNKNNEDKPISLRLWTELFHEALKDRAEELSIEIKDVSVYATAEIGSMPPWQTATSAGIIHNEGYSTDGYVDKTIRIMVKDNELMGILSIEDNQGFYDNALIEDAGGGRISVFFEGGTRIFDYDGAVPAPIGSLAVSDNEIVGLAFAGEKVQDVIKLTDIEKIEFQRLGTYELDEAFKIYDVQGSAPATRGLSALTTGTDIAEIYLKNDIAVGAIITDKAKAESLRVVISTTDFAGYIHESVVMEGNFKVTAGDNEIEIKQIILPGLSDELFALTNRIYIEPLKNGETTISSIQRDWPDSSPVYGGTFEIEKRDKGYVIVNEINIEEYLTAVVPSEMPTSYGTEAAKVQAVCARSYAVNQFFANKYHAYGANFDDSVLSQVYNNIPANDVSKTAVAETAGQVLKYGGEVISATFFSTSSGSFANSSDVWANGNQFPSDFKEYLSAHSVSSLDLTEEDNMRAFLKAEDAGYDTWSEWSRWTVDMTGQQLSQTVKNNLAMAYETNPPLVKTLQNDYSFKSRPVENIGRIKNMEVIKRGEGGIVMALKLEGEAGTVLLRTEYVIRSVLKPLGYDNGTVDILLKNGKTVNNYALMPSGFFVFDTEKDEEGFIASIHFAGGGLGHGAGMSQNGVKQMAEDGFDYKEILAYYYKNIEIAEE